MEVNFAFFKILHLSFNFLQAEITSQYSFEGIEVSITKIPIFVKHFVSSGNKVRKSYFNIKFKVKVIDLGVNWRGEGGEWVCIGVLRHMHERASLVSMYAKYEVSISYGSKVIANVTFDNRQTNRQTGQKQFAPDHSIRGHKNSTHA